MPSRNIQILKASGEKEAFKKEKLIHSLKRSGADSTEVASVVQEMDEWMFDGVSSKDIYKKAFSLLKKKRLGAAARYRLKQAMMEMGPTGYPFEIFIGQIFKSLGYEVEVGVTLDGACVTHEVDVIATKGLTQSFVECKYYQRTGKNANVQVPLYIRSRVNDLIDKRRQSTRWDAYRFEGWIATNTRFTLDAISYGVCSGLNLLSWDYPEGNSLREIVDRERIFPITVLTKLTQADKQKLMEMGIVICRQLSEKKHLLDEMGWDERKRKRVLKEAQVLCTAR